jgi:hypothetical protein
VPIIPLPSFTSMLILQFENYASEIQLSSNTKAHKKTRNQALTLLHNFYLGNPSVGKTNKGDFYWLKRKIITT